MVFSQEEGKRAVEIARYFVDAAVKGERSTIPEHPASFRKRTGVFTTLTSYPKRSLRGCIGLPEPVRPLIDALLESATSAALHDPRFPPVRPSELDELVVEVTLLTPPEPVEVSKPDDYLEIIRVGRDGLIAERGLFRGLLLPQVPVEWGWDVRDFLRHTCMKAGLAPDAWKEPGFKLYRFSGQVFAEQSPHGPVIAKELG